MKKMLVVAMVAAFAFAACGKKKDAAAPTSGGTTEPAGSAMGSDATPPAGDGSAAGSGEAAPATP
jgi:hypothetical protein